MRHVHRYLPGGRADQRHLSLSDAAVGDDLRSASLHALLEWLQDHAERAQQRNSARQQPRPFRHQRRVSLRQGPLRIRFHDAIRSASASPDAAQRQARTCKLGRRARRSGATPEASARDAWRASHRRDRLESHDERRKLSAEPLRARRRWARTTSITIAPPITPAWPLRSARERRMRRRRWRIFTPRKPCC